MRLLLDTSTFLWLVEGDPKLSTVAGEAIADAANQVFLSAASAWEIAIKHGLGRLHLQGSPEELVPQQRRLHRVDALPITEDTTLQVGKLPSTFTAIRSTVFLVAQAIVGGLTIVTPDRLIKAYPVPTLWE